MITDRPTDGLVLRWIDPQIAAAIECLPEYGRLEIAMVNGWPERKISVTRDILLPARSTRQDD